jgi:hypothetical protein
MNSTNQLLLRIMIAIVAIMGAVVAVILLVSDSMFQSSTNGKIIFITFSMLIYGITASFCYALTRKREYNGLAIFGMTVSAIAFFINLIFVITESRSTGLSKSMFAFFFLAIGLAHICFLFYITAQNKYAEAVRIVAIIFISLFTLLVVAKIFDSGEESFYMGRGIQNYIRYVLAVLTLNLTASLLVVLCNQIRANNPAELLFQNDPPNDNTNTGASV